MFDIVEGKSQVAGVTCGRITRVMKNDDENGVTVLIKIYYDEGRMIDDVFFKLHDFNETFSGDKLTPEVLSEYNQSDNTALWAESIMSTLKGV